MKATVLAAVSPTLAAGQPAPPLNTADSSMP